MVQAVLRNWASSPRELWMMAGPVPTFPPLVGKSVRPFLASTWLPRPVGMAKHDVGRKVRVAPVEGQQAEAVAQEAARAGEPEALVTASTHEFHQVNRLAPIARQVGGLHFQDYGGTPPVERFDQALEHLVLEALDVDLDLRDGPCVLRQALVAPSHRYCDASFERPVLGWNRTESAHSAVGWNHRQA